MNKDLWGGGAGGGEDNTTEINNFNCTVLSTIHTIHSVQNTTCITPDLEFTVLWSKKPTLNQWENKKLH